MYTFVESQKWEGKNIIALCTSGGSGLGRSYTDLGTISDTIGLLEALKKATGR